MQTAPRFMPVVIPMCFRSIQKFPRFATNGKEKIHGRNPYVFQVNSNLAPTKTRTRQSKLDCRNPYGFQVNSNSPRVLRLRRNLFLVVIPMCFRSIQIGNLIRLFIAYPTMCRNPYVFQVNSKPGSPLPELAEYPVSQS